MAPERRSVARKSVDALPLYSCLVSWKSFSDLWRQELCEHVEKRWTGSSEQQAALLPFCFLCARRQRHV